jgi:hypothetical protein
MNARNRSTKSGFMGMVVSPLPEFYAQTPHLEQALRRRHGQPVFEVVPVGLGCRVEPANREAGGA